MDTVKTLLDAAKQKTRAANDHQLSKAIGITSQRISDYYKERRQITNDDCMKLAETLGKPLDEVICAVEIQFAKTETRREAWKRYAKTLKGIALSFMIAAYLPQGVVTMKVTEAEESKQTSGLQSGELTRIQIMRLIRGLIALGRNRLKNAIQPLYWLNWPKPCKTA